MVLQFSEQMDRSEQVKTAKKRKTAAKKVETLDEAFDRLAELKWDSEEWADVQSVRLALQDGTLTRVDDSKRLSKKELTELSEQLREIERQRRIQKMVDSAPDNYRVVTDMKTFHQFINDLYEEPFTAWDTETTGLDLFDDRIVGVSCWLPKADYGVYVSFMHGESVGNGPAYGTIPGYKRFDGQLDADLVLENIRDYLESDSYHTVWHNAS